MFEDSLRDIKSGGWYSGIKSNQGGDSLDHIFPVADVGDLYLNYKDLSLENFIESWAGVFGLTIKLTIAQHQSVTTITKEFKDLLDSVNYPRPLDPASMMNEIAEIYQRAKIELGFDDNASAIVNTNVRDLIFDIFRNPNESNNVALLNDLFKDFKIKFY